MKKAVGGSRARDWQTAPVGLALVFASTWAWAQLPATEAPSADVAGGRPSMSLRLSAGQTDNLTRATERVRADISAFGVRLDARKDSGRFRGRVRTDAEYRHYEAAIPVDDDEVLGSFDGMLEVQAVPERFSWSVEQNYGQTRTDPLLISSPENRGGVRIFSTGPRLTLPAGERNAVELSGSVSERRYDDTRLLGSRVESAGLAFDHAINSVTTVGLEFDRTRNEFDLEDIPAYEFGIATLTYRREFTSGGVELRVGKGQVEFAEGDESTGVVRFAWTRGVGARSDVGLWARHELTDAGELFRLGGLQRGGDAFSRLADAANINDDRLRGVVLSADPLRRSEAGLQLNLVGSRTSVSFFVSAGSDDFEQSEAFNNDFEGISLSLSRPLARRWQASADFSVFRQDFDVLEQDNEDSAVRFGVSRSLGRQTSLALSVDHVQRGNGAVEFDERFYMVTFSYDL